ncbi:MAG: c-type cytochrome [Sphingobacteriaceae bacterium]|nr:MAG: c-type cytochrome [Sphingobacteriaceae bacterium]
MKFNKIIAVAGLLGGVVFMASMTTVQQVPQQQGPAQQPQAEVKYTNLKVLPKSIKKAALDRTMREWGAALGVRCNFCHANNPTTNRTDYALDTKPEKLMARKMYKMAATINKKYFAASKDSLGMMKETGVTCNSCHKGIAHPKVVYANVPRSAGAPGAAPGGFGGPGGQGAPAGGQRPAAAPGATPAPATNR